MSCINLVLPTELPDQLLFIEYRGLPLIFKRIRNHLDKGTIKSLKIPQSYNYGKGHMTFFYDKLIFLVERQKMLVNELLRREINITNINDIDVSDIPIQLLNNFTPNLNDIKLSREMISKWVNDANHYRWTASVKPNWI